MDKTTVTSVYDLIPVTKEWIIRQMSASSHINLFSVLKEKSHSLTARVMDYIPILPESDPLGDPPPTPQERQLRRISLALIILTGGDFGTVHYTDLAVFESESRQNSWHDFFLLGLHARGHREWPDRSPRWAELTGTFSIALDGKGYDFPNIRPSDWHPSRKESNLTLTTGRDETESHTFEFVFDGAQQDSVRDRVVQQSRQTNERIHQRENPAEVAHDLERALAQAIISDVLKAHAFRMQTRHLLSKQT